MFKNQSTKLFLLAALVLGAVVGVIVTVGELTAVKSTNECNQMQCDTTQCDSTKCDSIKCDQQ
jgi:hypothetical protein